MAFFPPSDTQSRREHIALPYDKNTNKVRYEQGDQHYKQQPAERHNTHIKQVVENKTRNTHTTDGDARGSQK